MKKFNNVFMFLVLIVITLTTISINASEIIEGNKIDCKTLNSCLVVEQYPSIAGSDWNQNGKLDIEETQRSIIMGDQFLNSGKISNISDNSINLSSIKNTSKTVGYFFASSADVNSSADFIIRDSSNNIVYSETIGPGDTVDFSLNIDSQDFITYEITTKLAEIANFHEKTYKPEDEHPEGAGAHHDAQYQRNTFTLGSLDFNDNLVLKNDSEKAPRYTNVKLESDFLGSIDESGNIIDNMVAHPGDKLRYSIKVINKSNTDSTTVNVKSSLDGLGIVDYSIESIKYENKMDALLFGVPISDLDIEDNIAIQRIPENSFVEIILDIDTVDDLNINNLDLEFELIDMPPNAKYTKDSPAVCYDIEIYYEPEKPTDPDPLRNLKIFLENPEYPDCNSKISTPLEPRPIIYPVFNVLKSSTISSDLNSDGLLNAGDTLSYNIETFNVGEVVGDVVIKDELLDVEFITSKVSNFKINGGSNYVPLNPKIEDLKNGITVTLNKGESVSLSFDLRIPSSGYENSDDLITNMAVIEPVDPNATCETECSSSVENVITPIEVKPIMPSLDPVAMFNVLKTSMISNDQNNDGLLNPGDTLTYNIKSTNVGEVKGDVTIIDELLDTEFLTNVISNFKISGGSNYVPLNPKLEDLKTGISVTLKKDETVNISFDLKIPSTGYENSDDLIENTVKIDPLDPNATCETTCESSVDNVITPIVIEPIEIFPIFNILKSSRLSTDLNNDGILNIGDTLTYNIKSTNVGEVKGDVTIIDELLDTEFLTSLISNFEISGGSNYVPLNPKIEDLKSGITLTLDKDETVNINFDVKVPLNGYENSDSLIENTVKIDPVDSNATCESGCESSVENVITPIVVDPTEPVPIFNILKTSMLSSDLNNDGLLNPGDTLTYNIKSTNVGEVKGDVLIKDELLDTEFLTSVISNFQIEGGDKYVPVDPKIDDLKSGITVTLDKQDEVNISFDVKILSSNYNNGNNLIENNVVIDPVDPNGKCDTTCESNVENIITPIVVDPSEQFPIFNILKSSIISNDLNNDGSLNPGDTLSYNIKSTNVGDVVGDLVIKDELLDVEFMTSKVSNFNISGGNNYVPVNPKLEDLKKGITVTLNKGESVNISFDLKIPSSGYENSDDLIENTVIIDPLNPNATCDNTCESSVENVITPIKVKPIMPTLDPIEMFNIIKTSNISNDQNNDGLLNPGDTLSYNIKSTNVGEVKGDVVIKDEFLDTEFLTSAISNFKIEGGSNYIPSNPELEDLKTGITVTLKKDETVNISFDVKIPLSGYENSDNLIQNIVKIDPLNPNATCETICESSVENVITSSIDNPIVPTPVFNISKSSKISSDLNNDGLLNPGEILSYNIKSTNVGEIKGDLNIKDELLDTELLTKLISNFKINGGKNYIPSNPNIEDLKSGITVTLEKDETVNISFDVKIPLNGYQISDDLIKNIAIIEPVDPIATCENTCESNVENEITTIEVEQFNPSKPEDKPIIDAENESILEDNTVKKIGDTGMNFLSLYIILMIYFILFLTNKNKSK